MMSRASLRHPPSNIGAWCVALLLTFGIRGLLSAFAYVLGPQAHALFAFLYRRVTHQFFLPPTPSIQWTVTAELAVSGAILFPLGILAGRRLLRD